MNGNKNVLFAIALSAAVLFVWQYFIATPAMKAEQARQANLTQVHKPAPNAASAAAPNLPGIAGSAGHMTRDAALKAGGARVVIDTPIPALGVKGDIALLQPISGLESSRNQLGLLAVVGAITFATEHRTRSVPRGMSIASMIVAALCIVFTFSPVVAGATVVVAIAAGLIYGIRRVPTERRQAVQLVFLGAAIVALLFAWFFRGSIVRLFNAGGVLDFGLHGHVDHLTHSFAMARAG